MADRAFTTAVPPVNAEIVKISRGTKILFRGRINVYTSGQTEEWISYSGNSVDAASSTTIAFPADGVTIDLSKSAAELPPPEPDENPLPGSPDGAELPVSSGGGTGGTGTGGDGTPPEELPEGLPEYPYIPPPVIPPDPSSPLADSYGEYLAASIGYGDRRPGVLLAYSAKLWVYFPPLAGAGKYTHPFPTRGLGHVPNPGEPETNFDADYWTNRWWAPRPAPPDTPAPAHLPPQEGTLRIVTPNQGGTSDEWRPAPGTLDGSDHHETEMLANPWWIVVYELGGFHWPLGATVDNPLIDRQELGQHGYAIPDSGVVVAGAAGRNANDHASTYFNGTDGRIVSPYPFPYQTKSTGRRTIFGPDWQPMSDSTTTPPSAGDVPIGPLEPAKLPSEVNPAWPDTFTHPDVRITGDEPIPDEYKYVSGPTWQPDDELTAEAAANPYFESKASYTQTGSISMWARREDESGNHTLLTSTGPDRWRMWTPEAANPPWPVGPRDLVVDIDSGINGIYIEEQDNRLAAPRNFMWWKNVMPPAGEWFHIMITNAQYGGATGRVPWEYMTQLPWEHWPRSDIPTPYSHMELPHASGIPHHTLDPQWGGFDYRAAVPYGGYNYPQQGFWTLFINGDFMGTRAGDPFHPGDYINDADHAIVAGRNNLFRESYPRRYDEFGETIMTDPPAGGAYRYPYFGNIVLGCDDHVSYYPWGAALGEPAVRGEGPGLHYRSWKGNVSDFNISAIGFDELAGGVDVDPEDGPGPNVYGQWYSQPWSQASYWFMNPFGRRPWANNRALTPEEIAAIPSTLRSRLDLNVMTTL